MEKIRIVFMGTPEFSVPVLEGLIENYNVVGVVTQPDKLVGRKREVKFSPVKEIALKNKIKVIQPTSIKNDYEQIIDLKPDMIITCAYGQFIPKEILSYPKYSCINVHASLLPKLRGGSPISDAIIKGYYKTGITIMYMEDKMDAGDIISQKETIIKKEDNVGTLHDRLSLIGKELLLETIPKILLDKITPIKQDEKEVTYAYNLTREDEHIDFNKTSLEIFNRVRGLNPFPGGYALLDNKVVKIYEVEMSDRVYENKQNGEITRIYNDGIGISVKDYEIILLEIKVEGKKKVKVKDYLNGIDKEKLLGKVLK